MNQHTRDMRTQKNTKEIWDLYKKQREEEQKLQKEHNNTMKQMLKEKQ